jgi:hypothetical protein
MELTLLAAKPTPSTLPQPSRGAQVALAAVAVVVVSALALAGITFFGLAVGFAIALPIAEQYHIAVSASDLEIVRQFAPFWAAFVAASVVSFAAAAFAIVKFVGLISPVQPE